MTAVTDEVKVAGGPQSIQTSDPSSVFLPPSQRKKERKYSFLSLWKKRKQVAKSQKSFYSRTNSTGT
eukprot:scaffold3153_cov253-Ochromonas_danica.AAC.2